MGIGVTVGGALGKVRGGEVGGGGVRARHGMPKSLCTLSGSSRVKSPRRMAVSPEATGADDACSPDSALPPAPMGGG